jgi:hypothetical protein
LNYFSKNLGCLDLKAYKYVGQHKSLIGFSSNNRIKSDNLAGITPLRTLVDGNRIDYLYSMFNQAFQKEIPALPEQRQVHYNLLTTFDTFGNALKINFKK